MASRLEKMRNVGSAVLAAGVLYGCTPRTPDVHQVLSPVPLSDVQQSGVEEVSGWLARDVPANRNTMYSFGDVGNYQCRPIGLSELYIMSDANYPLVAVGGIFDRSKARLTLVNEPAIMAGPIGFQPITSSTLTVNLGEALTVVTGAISNSAVEDFIQWSRPVMNIASRGLLDNRETAFYVVVERPAGGIANALVFREGIVQYNAMPSPKSCVKVKYNFTSPPSIPVPSLRRT